MNAHTPGPWHVNEQPNDLVRIIGAVDGDTYDDGSPRMIYTHVCDVIDNEDEQANARLIAKAPVAPKLAEALRKARDALYNVPEVGEEYDQQHSDTHMRAALLIDAALREWDAQS